jgi:hypothetical protein
MFHVFNQSEHPFGQCGHFNQVDLFEKPWFLVMFCNPTKTQTYGNKCIQTPKMWVRLQIQKG